MDAESTSQTAFNSQSIADAKVESSRQFLGNSTNSGGNICVCRGPLAVRRLIEASLLITILSLIAPPAQAYSGQLAIACSGSVLRLVSAFW